MTKLAPVIKKKSTEDHRSSKTKKTKSRKGRKQSKYGCCKTITSYVTTIVMVFGLTFLNLQRFQYSNHFISVDGSGELSVRHFEDDINTVLCDRYHLSAWTPFEVYLTSGKATIDKVNRETVKREAYQLFPKGFTSNNDFYLLEGSVIHVNACRIQERSGQVEDSVDFLVIKGEDAWEQFKNGKCNDCAVENTNLPFNAYCENGDNVQFTYSVSERDTYRVTAVKQREGYSTFYIPISAELNIDKTIFDTANAKMICATSSECTVPLQYGQDPDVVVRFGSDIFITTKCQFRFLFCIGVFVIVPCCLLAIAFTCYAVVSIAERNEKKKRKNIPELLKINVISENVRVQDKTSVVNNELPSSYDSLKSF